MAADQPEQQPPPISQSRYESSQTAGPSDPAGSTSSPDPAGASDAACSPGRARGSACSTGRASSLAHGRQAPSGPPGEEPQDDEDRVAALVAEVRAQGPLPGPRPDPQRSHRPPLLPHLPDVEREEVDAIIGRVLAESTGS